MFILIFYMYVHFKMFLLLYLCFYTGIVQGFLEKQVHWFTLELNETTMLNETMNK